MFTGVFDMVAMQDEAGSSVNDARTCEKIDTPLTQPRSRRVPIRQRDLEVAATMAAPSHVYFIYSAGRIKIGVSTHWMARVDQVCSGCPHHAELVLVMPGDRKLEAGYHDIFANLREGGEWFRFEGNLKRFLEHYASPEGAETLALADAAYLEEVR